MGVIMLFEFATANKIIFGCGSFFEAAKVAVKMGKKIFLITGHDNNRAKPLLEILKEHNSEVAIFNVSGEPTVEMVSMAVKKARLSCCDLVIGIGGGSVLDTGKVVAALLANSGELMEYLEVIGEGKQINNPSIPYIAIATTAGTGAEVTRNAVLDSPEHKVKVSMRSPYMLPYMAVVDPKLTLSTPPLVTASTGLDALTQVIEPYVSNKANPLTDTICKEGIMRAGRSLKKAFEDGSNIEAREDMAIASLFGGLALANAKLGAVHGMAGPMGGMYNIPHGIICARLLPLVMEKNLNALRSRSPDSLVIKRFDIIAQILTGNSAANAIDGVKWIKELCFSLKIPPLSKYGVVETDFASIIKKSQKASSMKGNPIVLNEEELSEILKEAV